MGARTLAEPKPSTQGLAAHAFEAEGDATKAPGLETAGVVLEDGPHAPSDSERAATTPPAATLLGRLGTLGVFLLRGVGGTSGEPRQPTPRGLHLATPSTWGSSHRQHPPTPNADYMSLCDHIGSTVPNFRRRSSATGAAQAPLVNEMRRSGAPPLKSATA